MIFRLASENDAIKINTLINQAYRGEKGWTRETEIIEGNRSLLSDIIKLIENPISNLFAIEIDDMLVACICVEEKKDKAHIGTFAVNPNLQNQGLGKKILNLAEEYAIQELGYKITSMAVISQRKELISFYERQGYIKTGRKFEYPTDLNIGVPKIKGVTIEHLEKVHNKSLERNI